MVVERRLFNQLTIAARKRTGNVGRGKLRRSIHGLRDFPCGQPEHLQNRGFQFCQIVAPHLFPSLLFFWMRLFSTFFGESICRNCWWKRLPGE
jgi:hypothetical protein